MIPAALGNILGGSLFCGMYYWWMYLFGEPAIAVDGVYYDSMHSIHSSAGHLDTAHPRRKDEENQAGAVESERSSS